MKSIIKNRFLGSDIFRLQYKGVYFLIQYNQYNKLSDINWVSEQDLNKSLSRENKRFYENVLRDIVKKYGARVVKISDSKNDKDMKDYIEARFAEGVFKGDEDLKEELLVGLGCDDIALEQNIRDRYRHPVLRIKYADIDMLIVYDN